MFFAAALCCIVSAVMVSCGKDNPDTPEPEPTPDPEPEVPVTPKDTVVYAVGQEAVPGKGYYYATIWKDGKRILLSDGSYDAFCNGAYADGRLSTSRAAKRQVTLWMTVTMSLITRMSA